MRALVLAYIITLPLLQAAFFTLPLGKALVPSDLVFFALVLALLVKRASWRWPSLRLCVAAALPPTVMLLSALSNDSSPVIAARETLRTTYSMFVLVVMATLPGDERLGREITRTWCATSILVCAIGLGAYLAVTLFGASESSLARANSANLGPGVVRISGLLPTNTLSLYLVVSAAFAIALATRGESSWDRGLGRAALSSAVAVSTVSLSRGVLGLLVFLALVAFCRDVAPRWLAKLRWPTAVAVTLLAGATLVATWWASFPIERVAGGEGWRLNWRHNAYRTLHLAGLRMFVAHPVAGVGPGAFGTRLADFSSIGERSASWPPVDASLNSISHSSWIGFLAEGGLPLFAAWIAVLALLIRHLFDSPAKGLQPLLGLALVGIAVNGLHVNFEHLKFIWAAAGLALCGGKAPGLARGD